MEPPHIPSILIIYNTMQRSCSFDDSTKASSPQSLYDQQLRRWKARYDLTVEEFREQTLLHISIMQAFTLVVVLAWTTGHGKYELLGW